jgi:hypothetical protein
MRRPGPHDPPPAEDLPGRRLSLQAVPAGVQPVHCHPWKGTHRTPAEILLILRGFLQGVSTAQLARELGASRPHLLELRHQVQAHAAAADRTPLPDAAVEADEMYQNAGEKRRPAP